MNLQTTDTILMIRPAHFGFNAETAESNKFQRKKNQDEQLIIEKAKAEFDAMVVKLTEAEINVIVIEDTAEPVKPDAVFPNNWISFHEDGTLITYPMQAAIRRKERREDIIDLFEKEYQVDRRYSLEMFEAQYQYLEGTGSMVLDRSNKVVYACLSPRTNPQVLNKFSLLMGYDTVFFNAYDINGDAIYHTNVMMAVGVDFVVCCIESIEKDKRPEVMQFFEKTGKTLIDITFGQMEKFAGNMLQVKNTNGEAILIMSQTAYDSLDPQQIRTLMSKTKIITVDINTIETIGGGSARCMMAEVFLKKKKLKKAKV